MKLSEVNQALYSIAGATAKGEVDEVTASNTVKALREMRLNMQNQLAYQKFQRSRQMCITPGNNLKMG